MEKGNDKAERNIHMYNRVDICSFSNRSNPDISIGEMLSYFLEEGYSYVNLLLHDDNIEPIALKYKGRLWEFNYFQISSRNILERIPPDSFWSQLMKKKITTVTPTGVSEYQQELKLPRSLTAEKLLADRLEKHERDVGILFDKDKLYLSILSPSIHVFESTGFKPYDWERISKNPSILRK